jgi:hypothetical protein
MIYWISSRGRRRGTGHLIPADIPDYGGLYGSGDFDLDPDRSDKRQVGYDASLDILYPEY